MNFYFLLKSPGSDFRRCTHLLEQRIGEAGRGFISQKEKRRNLMLERVEEIFDDMPEMLKQLKKASYEKNMNEFRRKYGHYISEMLSNTEQSFPSADGAKEAAVTFVNAVETRFVRKKKIIPRIKADITFFMTYYVFPAILLNENEHSALLAQSLCEEFNSRFQASLRFTDYDSLYNSFQEKLFGIF